MPMRQRSSIQRLGRKRVTNADIAVKLDSFERRLRAVEMSHKEWAWFKETLHRIALNTSQLGERIVVLAERLEGTESQMREVVRLAQKQAEGK